MRNALSVAAVVVLAAFAAGAASAEETARPGLYFRQCGECHGSARKLLEKRAVLKDGILLGRASNRDIRVFLGNHFGTRSESDVAAIHMELLRVAQHRGRFQQQCAICHVSAAALARESLVLRDGELFGRYSGRGIAQFLTRHGGPESENDRVFFEEVLRRNLPGGG